MGSTRQSIIYLYTNITAPNSFVIANHASTGVNIVSLLVLSFILYVIRNAMKHERNRGRNPRKVLLYLFFQGASTLVGRILIIIILCSSLNDSACAGFIGGTPLLYGVSRYFRNSILLLRARTVMPRDASWAKAINTIIPGVIFVLLGLSVWTYFQIGIVRIFLESFCTDILVDGHEVVLIVAACDSGVSIFLLTVFIGSVARKLTYIQTTVSTAQSHGNGRGLNRIAMQKSIQSNVRFSILSIFATLILVILLGSGITNPDTSDDNIGKQHLRLIVSYTTPVESIISLLLNMVLFQKLFKFKQLNKNLEAASSMMSFKLG